MIISTHDYFNSSVKFTHKIFFLFLLQKMEHDNDVIISKKSRIMTTVKKFKEEITLHSHKNTTRELIFFEKAIKVHEELANDEDEDDIMYLNGYIIYFENLFNDYFIKNNTNDQVLEKPIINNSTFIETPAWLKLKRYVLNKLVKITVE